MSIGLRLLDFSIIHPINVGISKAIDERATQGAATILADFGKTLGAGAVAGPGRVIGGPAVGSAEKPRVKKVSRKVK